MTRNPYEGLGSVVWLNLEFVTLYGFERYKSARRIESIIKGIEAGDDFPPVFVERFPKNEYGIVRFVDEYDNTNYGGHNRAVAHYIEGKPLKCIVLGNSFLNRTYHDVKIPEIIITEESDSDSEIEELRRFDKRYR